MYLPFIEAIVPVLFESEEADHPIRRVNQAAPDKANEGYLLHSIEQEARGPSACQLRDLQMMKHLRLPNWEGSEFPVWPPHRPPNAALIAPMLGGDPRLYTAEWVRAQIAQLANQRLSAHPHLNTTTLCQHATLAPRACIQTIPEIQGDLCQGHLLPT